MKKKTFLITILVSLLIITTTTIAFAGGKVIKSTGKDAAPLNLPCPILGGAYCNSYQIPTAKGKVNLIQPNGNVDVIFGVGADGLAPNTLYKVFFDTNGGTGGPWVVMGTFWTNDYGSGHFNYTAPAGTYADGTHNLSVWINRTDAGYTILFSPTISFEIAPSP